MSTSSSPEINFFTENISITLRNRTKLKQFISSLFKKESKNLQTLNYVFCSDEHLLSINRQYLNHDYYTDIITFDLSENKNSIIGDIYISYDRIKDNAKTQNTTIKEELHRVIFHGALHLCGYKDKTKNDIKLMREKEETYLTLYSKSIRST
jgi:probable rRNA maturation factor